jgi:broad specificity phosphatase PhoE
MSVHIWIARHGNRLDFVHPQWFNTAIKRYDPPLSEDGKIQAQELAQRLKSEQINHLLASPFLRTIQTAHIVADTLDLTIKLEAGLSEWHNSDWMSETPQIHSQKELEPLYPRIDWSYRSQILPKYPETKSEVLKRMKLTAETITEQFSGNVLLIGHGISVVGIAQGLLNSQEEIKASLCSLTKLVKNNLEQNDWQLMLNGETSFLTNPQQKIIFN